MDGFADGRVVVRTDIWTGDWVDGWTGVRVGKCLRWKCRPDELDGLKDKCAIPWTNIYRFFFCINCSVP